MIDRAVERGVFVLNTNEIKLEMFSSFGDVEGVRPILRNYLEWL